MNIAVVDHGAGNLVSIAQALEEVGAGVTVVAGPEFSGADAVVLPGVGATAPTMERLRASGFAEALAETSLPLLGICVGMQVLFEESHEDGARGLGLLPGPVVGLAGAPRLPHMGWNEVRAVREDPLLAGLGDAPLFYFVHSYAPRPSERSHVVATARHGVEFVAMVRSGMTWGVQFHPERSGWAGLTLLGNFVAEVKRAA